VRISSLKLPSWRAVLVWLNQALLISEQAQQGVESRKYSSTLSDNTARLSPCSKPNKRALQNDLFTNIKSSHVATLQHFNVRLDVGLFLKWFTEVVNCSEVSLFALQRSAWPDRRLIRPPASRLPPRVSCELAPSLRPAKDGWQDRKSVLG
jgi:hypothetical protein